eukprot:COSAG06_NODE_24458_length_662_cov_0.804618_1_plen_86_part_10
MHDSRPAITAALQAALPVRDQKRKLSKHFARTRLVDFARTSSGQELYIEPRKRGVSFRLCVYVCVCTFYVYVLCVCVVGVCVCGGG